MTRKPSMKILKAFKPYMIKKIKKRMIFIVKLKRSTPKNQRSRSRPKKPPAPKMPKQCLNSLRGRLQSQNLSQTLMVTKPMYKLSKRRTLVNHCLRRCGSWSTQTKSKRRKRLRNRRNLPKRLKKWNKKHLSLRRKPKHWKRYQKNLKTLQRKILLKSQQNKK